ncbi:MAG: DNA-formamidopyrimidine glycosylase family protein [Verrucomicrobiota bacterium JB023]|nr:DNA-formamidopyrimidine glycosylase family protein [Verrucomicrobiota bacterium JB023]
MPELAEVELARRLWLPAEGEILQTVDTHPRTRIYRDTPASAIEKRLKGARLVASRSHGKRLLFIFTREALSLPLEIHLGMSGRLQLAPQDHDPHKHDHLILRTSNFSLVFNDYRQFGRAHLHEEPNPWEHLPPEILSRSFTLAYIEEKLKKRARTNLKALLLDQNAFPGIGNWMADEICWRLRLHPATPTAELNAEALRNETRWVTKGALRHVADKNQNLVGQVDKGFSPGSYVAQVPPASWLFQHRWTKGGTCPRCRTDLERATIAARTTAWCPACQPFNKK